MQLVHLATAGFRNLAPMDLELSNLFHVFHGSNGHGKTNVLESIYFLSNLKPLRGRKTKDLIQWGETQATVSAGCEDQGLVRRFRTDITQSGRTCSIDGKKVHKMAEYFGGIRCIAFTPTDARIVSDEPALRRSWVDRAAFTKSPIHLEHVKQYERLRAQKSAVLKSDRPDASVLDVLDHQLSVSGSNLVVRRRQLIEELSPHIRALHAKIVGLDEEISIKYESQLSSETSQEIQAELAGLYQKHRSEELRRRSVLYGPHRDDVGFVLGERPARVFGSRGQIRSIVLALKLAELLAARARGQHPVFLLDDLSSELDQHRTKQLVDTLEELGTQVFITTTDPDFLRTLPPEKTRFILVNKGTLSVGGSGT